MSRETAVMTKQFRAYFLQLCPFSTGATTRPGFSSGRNKRAGPFDEMFERDATCHYPLHKRGSIFRLDRASRMSALLGRCPLCRALSRPVSSPPPSFTIYMADKQPAMVTTTQVGPTPILIPISSINLPERLQPRNHKTLWDERRHKFNMKLP